MWFWNANILTSLATFARCLSSLYLILFFTVVLPFHQHVDLEEHQDTCAICAAAHQPLLLTVAAVAIIVPLVAVVRTTVHVFLVATCTAIPHLRSPPAC